MAGYWPSYFAYFFLCVFVDRDGVQYPAVLTEQACKELLSVKRTLFTCGIQRLIQSGRDSAFFPILGSQSQRRIRLIYSNEYNSDCEHCVRFLGKTFSYQILSGKIPIERKIRCFSSFMPMKIERYEAPFIRPKKKKEKKGTTNQIEEW